MSSTTAILGYGYVSNEECDYYGNEAATIDASQAIEEDLGVTIGYHCTGECPMIYVAVKKSVVVAYRGVPASLSSLGPMYQDVSWWNIILVEAIERVRRDHASIAKQIGLDSAAMIGPAWFLCSLWD